MESNIHFIHETFISWLSNDTHDTFLVFIYSEWSFLFLSIIPHFFFCSLNKYELQGSDLPSVLIPNTSPELWHHILITWICSHLFPASCLINLILFQCSAFITQPSQVSANTRAHMHPAPSPPSNSCKGIYCTNILWVNQIQIHSHFFILFSLSSNCYDHRHFMMVSQLHMLSDMAFFCGSVFNSLYMKLKALDYINLLHIIVNKTPELPHEASM